MDSSFFRNFIVSYNEPDLTHLYGGRKMKKVIRKIKSAVGLVIAMAIGFIYLIFAFVYGMYWAAKRCKRDGELPNDYYEAFEEFDKTWFSLKMNQWFS